MMDLFNNTSVWITLSFIVFVYVAFKYGRHSVLSGLDGKIHKIKTDLETAESLRLESQELLAQYQRKQREANKESERIVNMATQQAAQIQKKCEKDIEESIVRREEWLAERLKRMEQDAIEDIKSRAVDMAIETTEKVMLSRLDEKMHAKLVKKTAKQIPNKLH